MKLGIAVAPAEALPSAFVVFRDRIEVCIEKAYRLGFDGIELALLDPAQVDVDKVCACCSERGMEIPMISSGQVFAQGGLCFTSPDAAVRREAVARIKGLVDLAEGFGAMVNIGRVRGPLQPGHPAEDSEKRFLESLQEVAGHARPKGVDIAIEPVNRYEIDYINTVAEAAEVVRRLNEPNVKIMPDLFHMNIEEASIEGALMAHAEHIGYLHFADSNRHAPGRGHLNFPNMMHVLEVLGYEGYLTAEILPYPDPDEAALQAARYLRALVPR